MKRSLALALLTACASTSVGHLEKPMTREILVSAHGQKTLVHPHCEEFYSANALAQNTCSKWVVTPYDLSSKDSRQILRAAHFVCIVGTRSRYMICEDRPGLCRHTVTGHWPFHKDLVDYIDQSENARLTEAGTRCYSEDQPGRGI